MGNVILDESSEKLKLEPSLGTNDNTTQTVASVGNDDSLPTSTFAIPDNLDSQKEASGIELNGPALLQNNEHGLPQWLLEHCVTLSEEWDSIPDPLILKDSECVDDVTNSTSAERISSTQESDASTYEMASILFEPFRGFVQSKSVSSFKTRSTSCNDARHTMHENFLRLQAVQVNPEKDIDVSRFLESVVKHIAKTARCDLVILTPNDLEDLADHLWQTRTSVRLDEYDGYVKLLLYLPVTTSADNALCTSPPPSQQNGKDLDQSSCNGTQSQKNQKRETSSVPTTILQILAAPSIKRALQPDDTRQDDEQAPLVIYLTLEEDDFDSSLLESLHRATSHLALQKKVLFIISTQDFPCEIDDFEPPLFVRQSYAPSPGLTTESVGMTLVVPYPSFQQRTLLEAHDKLARRHHNIRILQREIRRKAPRDADISLTTPYAEWAFLDDANMELFEEKDGSKLSSCIEGIIRTIGVDYNDERIRNSVLRQGSKNEALRAWEEPSTQWFSLSSAEDTETDGKRKYDHEKNSSGCGGSSRWSNFPLAAQKVIKEVEAKVVWSSQHEFYWEQRFLSLLVDPKKAEAGWNDIVLDTRIENTIKDVVSQHCDVLATSTAYGLLKTSHMGGALLYGPPGTGKTQLARVLARESGSVVICASASEIEHKYVGDTPKAIRALFNLGKLLAPSIIFIDEADSLFLRRQSSEKSWERERVNQFLAEMDGFSKSKAAPFVLLSTNFPGDLDPAVLRRVPTKLHIGLPPIWDRLRIFEIILREEILHCDLGLHDLANMTPRYSGSDIRHLCVQAAIMCEDFVKDGQEKGKRLLTKKVFEAALERVSPTVTKAAIAHIRGFAKENDPAGLDQMIKIEDAEFAIRHLGPRIWSSPSSTAGDDDQNKEPVLSTIVLPSPTATTSEGQPKLFTSPRSMISSDRDTRPFNTPSLHKKAEFQDNEIYLKVKCEKPLYEPLEKESTKIRVLSIDPVNNTSSAPELIVCTLDVVDLKDWTPGYKSFISGLSHLEGALHPNRGSVRHSLWDLHNQPVSEDHPSIAGNPDHVPISQDLPLDNCNGLLNRYKWGDYIALSYVWGCPSPSKQIILNGTLFDVGPNLHDALLRLRKSFEIADRGLKVWIDAICINQNDIGERANEVQKMSMIYADALAVRAWLGNPSLEVACELLVVDKLFGDIFKTRNTKERRASKRQEEPAFNPTKAFALLDWITQDEDNTYSIFVVFEHIFSQPYWERLWVVQEVFLAPSLLFWYGDCSFSTPELSTVAWSIRLWDVSGPIYNLSRYLDVNRLHTCLANRQVALEQLSFCRWRAGPAHHEVPLSKLIDVSRASQATDPRDKVYGFYSLLAPEISKSILLDYSPDFGYSDCWTMFARECFTAQKSLNLLARSAGRRTGAPSMPTWAFDLTYRRPLGLESVKNRQVSAVDLMFEGEHHGENHFVGKTIFKSDLSLTADFNFSENGCILHCKGTFIDAVANIIVPKRSEQAVLPAVQPSSSNQKSALGSGKKDVKLSLARTLSHDSTFNFGDGPSVLDIPWITPSQLQHLSIKPNDMKFETTDTLARIEVDKFGVREWKTHLDENKATSRSTWVQLYQTPWAYNFFATAVHPIEDSELQGTPLKNFFTSEADYCEGLEVFGHLMTIAKGAIAWRNLFTTQRGLVGSVTKHALPGDRIAVIYGCDTPLILRPAKNQYEVIGSCFIDGYMNGEVAEYVKNGSVVAESIYLC